MVEAEAQRWLQNATGHSVRLDVWCEDDEGRVYDIEIQKRKEGAGARRLKGAKEGRRRMNSEFEKVVREITEASRKEWELKGEKRGERRGEKRGEKRGERNAAIKAARSMLADGLVPPDKVAEYSGLSLGEVESLKDSLRI